MQISSWCIHKLITLWGLRSEVMSGKNVIFENSWRNINQLWYKYVWWCNIVGRGVFVDVTNSKCPVPVNLYFQWILCFFKVPSSLCSNSCLPGTRKATQIGKPLCCHDCIACPQVQFSNETGKINLVINGMLKSQHLNFHFNKLINDSKFEDICFILD